MDRQRLLNRAILLSAASIGLSAAVGSAAVAVAFTTQSLSLLGFGADAVIDSAASVVLLWRFTTEARHPHRASRIEQVAERLVGGVLLVLAAYLIISALGALASGSHPEASTSRIALLLTGLGLLPPLALAKYRVAQALASRALRLDRILTQSRRCWRPLVSWHSPSTSCSMSTGLMPPAGSSWLPWLRAKRGHPCAARCQTDRDRTTERY